MLGSFYLISILPTTPHVPGVTGAGGADNVPAPKPTPTGVHMCQCFVVFFNIAVLLKVRMEAAEHEIVVLCSVYLQKNGGIDVK